MWAILWIIGFVILVNLLVVAVAMDPDRIKNKNIRDEEELKQRKIFLIRNIQHTHTQLKHFPKDELLYAKLERLESALSETEMELKFKKTTS